MKFSNTFDVSLPPEEAWVFLLDVERIVPCMPGAELLEKIDDRNFKGKISVKLGPVALTFVCLAVFEEISNDTFTARIKAQGTDPKGRGGANALIGLHLEPSAKGSTVLVDTDLTLTGAVAQYGRGAGMIQSVANQIVSQFAKNLEFEIGELKKAKAAQDIAQPLTPSVPTQQTTLAAGEATRPLPAGDTAPTARPAPATAPLKTPARQAKPISGFALLTSSLWASIRGFFGKA